MKRIGFCAMGLVLAVVASGQAPTAHKTGAPKPAQTPPPAAAWVAGWETFGGINETQFHEMGIDKLNPQQAANLLLNIINVRPSFSCYKFYPITQKEELKHVHLYVESASDKSAEFVGRLRIHLSAIHDVSLVYSDEDADYIVGVLAMPIHVGQRETGYVASTVVLQPCIYRASTGLDKGEQIARKIVEHYVNTGPDEDGLASAITNDLNGQDFDEIRRAHASTLKYYENR
jgi:hypothetical protein